MSISKKTEKKPGAGVGCLIVFLLFFVIIPGCLWLIPSGDSGERSTPPKAPTNYQSVNYQATIDAEDFQYMSSKKVNVWPSYSDRSKILGTVKQGDTVIVIGRDSANDYCQITKGSLKGWLACGWIKDR